MSSAEAEAAVFVKETKQHKVTSAAANRLAFIGGGPIAGINKDLKWDNQCLHLSQFDGNTIVDNADIRRRLKRIRPAMAPLLLLMAAHSR